MTRSTPTRRSTCQRRVGLTSGDGVVLTVLVVKGLVSGAGDLNMRYAQVNEWRDGLIARETLYLDIDEARAAAERLAEERG